jgi:hypothetical protein
VDGTRQEDHFLEAYARFPTDSSTVLGSFVTKTRSEQVRRTQGGPQSRFPGYVMSSSVREGQLGATGSIFVSLRILRCLRQRSPRQ